MKSILPPIICLLWGFLIYANSLQVPFVFDDIHNIRENVLTRIDRTSAGELLKAAFQIGKAGREGSNPSRPVGNVSFALNYYFHQYNLFGYHIVNITIHLLTACFLYLFILKTLNLPSMRDTYRNPALIAFGAAILWLTHPVGTQSVTYTVQRYNSLAAMFFMLSLLLYLNGRTAVSGPLKWRWFAGAAFTGLLALGSKQNAATLPLFVLLYEWFFFQELNAVWFKKQAGWVGGFAIIGLVLIVAYLGGSPIEKIASGYANRDFTLAERLLTQPRIVVFYISLLAFPHPSRLNLDHDVALSQNFLSPPTTALAIVAITALIIGAMITARKHRLTSFAVLWFFGNLMIESSVISLELFFEHRTYLPSVFPAIALVTWWLHHSGNQQVAVIGLSVVIMAFSYWTYQRNTVWQNEVVFWVDGVKKSPQKARPHVELGEALGKNNQGDAAIAHYRKAIQLEPDNETAHNNLGYELDRKGLADEALGHYRKAIQIRSDYATPHNNLGVLFYKQGDLDNAIRHYRKAMTVAPHYCEAQNNLASALVTLGQAEDAIPLFKSVINLCPENSAAYAGLYGALRLLNEKIAAQQAYERLKAMDKDLAVEIKTAIDRMLPDRETGPNTINP